MIELSNVTRSILLIEDERVVAEKIGQHLERRGFDVDVVCDGVSGLRLATSRCYDAIVLDLTLPGLDGLEVCRELRASTGPASPVLLIAEQECIDESRGPFPAVAVELLIKPLALSDLDRSLDRLLAPVARVSEAAAGRIGRVRPQSSRSRTRSRDRRVPPASVSTKVAIDGVEARSEKGRTRA